MFFRRRRGQSRAIHRSVELGRRVPPARAVRVRGQPDFGDHAHWPDDRRCRCERAGREYRGVGHEGRRQRRRGRRRRRRTPRRRSARRRRPALSARGNVSLQGARLRRSRRVPRQGGSAMPHSPSTRCSSRVVRSSIAASSPIPSTSSTRSRRPKSMWRWRRPKPRPGQNPHPLTPTSRRRVQANGADELLAGSSRGTERSNGSRSFGRRAG